MRLDPKKIVADAMAAGLIKHGDPAPKFQRIPKPVVFPKPKFYIPPIKHQYIHPVEVPPLEVIKGRRRLFTTSPIY
jgi:hypothetical protein